jgi:hypothetical protein
MSQDGNRFSLFSQEETMTLKANSAEEVASRSEDEVRERLAAGNLIEGEEPSRR